MEEKGLCITCVNDKDCTFSRKFPVLQCEEFSDYEPTTAKKNSGSAVKYGKRQESRCVDVETTESLE